jgi:hypothetical protein
MTTINITDLLPVRHGDAVLKVDSKLVTEKGIKGHRGIVQVTFPKTPVANYVVKVDGPLRLTDVDATADAINLRRDIIAQNKVTTSRENDESNANYHRIQRAEDGHRE